MGVPMKVMRWFGFGCLVAAAGLVAGCDGGGGEAKAAKYAVVTNGVASFWDICKAGAEKAGEDLQVDVEVLMPDGVEDQKLSLIHISEPTRQYCQSRMPSSA